VSLTCSSNLFDASLHTISVKKKKHEDRAETQGHVSRLENCLEMKIEASQVSLFDLELLAAARMLQPQRRLADPGTPAFPGLLY
jgi:hypothetical protein